MRGGGRRDEAAPKEKAGESRRVAVSFTDLRYTTPHSHTGDKVEILAGVSGRCQPSRLLAIMGRSGAGALPAGRGCSMTHKLQLSEAEADYRQTREFCSSS